MGTNIHLWAERRGVDGRWSKVEPEDGSRLDDGGSRPWLYAVLADVRNRDPRRGEPYRPIDSPRGLPADVSSEVRAAAEEWGADAYAHSWLGVRELLDFDWERVVVRRGVVYAHQFAAWDGVSAPASYCVWVLASQDCDIDNDAMRRLVDEARAHHYPLPLPSSGLSNECPSGIPAELHERIRTCFTSVEWSETYRTSCNYFLDTTLPKLLPLGPADDLRIVFFFDGYY